MKNSGLRILWALAPEQGGAAILSAAPHALELSSCDKKTAFFLSVDSFAETAITDLAIIVVDNLLPHDFSARDLFLWRSWGALRLEGFVYVTTKGSSLGGGSVSCVDDGHLAMRTIPGFRVYRSWVTQGEADGRIGHILIQKCHYEE